MKDASRKLTARKAAGNNWTALYRDTPPYARRPLPVRSVAGAAMSGSPPSIERAGLPAHADAPSITPPPPVHPSATTLPPPALLDLSAFAFDVVAFVFAADGALHGRDLCEAACRGRHAIIASLRTALSAGVVAVRHGD